MQAPICLSDTLTIRAEDGVTAIELTTPGALITVTPAALTIMTRRQVHHVAWSDLLDLLDDAAAGYDADEYAQIITVPTPEQIIEENRRALRAWLLSQPGVNLLNNHRNGNGYHA